MKRHALTVLLTTVLCITTARVSVADEAKDVLDKAIAALGGEQKLSEVKAVSWKTKGKLIFEGNENEFTSETTVQGLDHMRGTFEGNFGGNQVQAATVLNGDEGWRSFAGMTMPLDASSLASEKRNLYLLLGPALLVPLKGEGFELKSAGEKQVNGKSAVGLKVVGPDKKDFTIYFDKETNLPVMQSATVLGFMGEEYKQETTFDGYKDFDGIKKATKIEQKRDGTTFLVQEITEFKVLDEVPENTFAEPK